MDGLELLQFVVETGVTGVALVALSLALRMAHETIRTHIYLSYGETPPSAMKEFSGERSGASPEENSEIARLAPKE